ncbi:putative inactive dehydrogenase EasA [Mycena sanguinolenta]|uniref:Putative inactive dehydrogenase EasA n=1 Tax=Mycena sanguinolenta TaxID=230812 RepID=A0A8H6Z016_9AGAR|nr:putative inactive dehydrogenase EasA [Mycena sanguinolenta]
MIQPLPFRIGNVHLRHRVVLAPLTRFKADDAHVPFLPLVADYYSQRASKPGTLLITEATFIAARAGGYAHIPGIWSLDQIEAWKTITAAVHAKGSFIFLQLWTMGRIGRADQLISEDPTFPYVSASDVPLQGRPGPPPRPLTVPEIKEYVALYVQAAKNAIEAGFDGVEIHSANGYLLDQFLQDVSNKRADEYGGSIENRARFTLEVVDAIASAVGPQRTAIRFSPWSRYQGSFILAVRHSDLAYLHLVEPRIAGSATAEDPVRPHESNEPLRALWAPRPLIRAGGFTREGALAAAESGDLVAFGRYYVSNPDLPTRVEKNIPLNAYDRSTFYLVGENGPRGYTDHPFAEVEAAGATVAHL